MKISKLRLFLPFLIFLILWLPNCLLVVFATLTPKDRCWLKLEFIVLRQNGKQQNFFACCFHEIVIERILKHRLKTRKIVYSIHGRIR